MTTLISTVIIGIIISAIGVMNMTGNISSLHSYHRKRVSEENKKPFGKLIGLGTLIIGISLIIFGLLTYLTDTSGNPVYTVIGTVQLIVCIILGTLVSFYAMKKYNGGIF